MLALTVGSAFWHGSHTLLGNIADNRFIDVVRFEICIVDKPESKSQVQAQRQIGKRNLDCRLCL